LTIPVVSPVGCAIAAIDPKSRKNEKLKGANEKNKLLITRNVFPQYEISPSNPYTVLFLQ